MTDTDQKCGEFLSGFECHRSEGHDGKHQAPANEHDEYFGLQLVEWWSIKPNGDPIERDTE